MSGSSHWMLRLGVGVGCGSGVGRGVCGGGVGDGIAAGVFAGVGDGYVANRGKTKEEYNGPESA